MEEQDSAASRGPERASESPAQPPLEARESSASSPAAPEHGYSEPQSGGGAGPAGAPGSGGDRPRPEGEYSRFRDRGGRGRGGRGRRPPRGRASGGARGAEPYDRPPREGYPADEPGYRAEPREREDDEFRARETEREDGPRYEDEDVPPAIDEAPEGEGAPEAVTDEPHEADEFHEERTEADREHPEERPRAIERVRDDRPPERGRDRGFERRGGGRDRDRDRGRGGNDRDRSTYRILRGQIDRVRHGLESVLRDMERVLGALQQAEQERHLTEQELDSLHEQIDQLQRGGRGGGSHDRGHRRHDETDR